MYDYCNEWKLEINAQKTKIVSFRNGGKSRNTENWSHNGNHIDIVSLPGSLNEFYLELFFIPRNMLLIREEKHFNYVLD